MFGYDFAMMVTMMALVAAFFLWLGLQAQLAHVEWNRLVWKATLKKVLKTLTGGHVDLSSDSDFEETIERRDARYRECTQSERSDPDRWASLHYLENGEEEEPRVADEAVTGPVVDLERSSPGIAQLMRETNVMLRREYGRLQEQMQSLALVNDVDGMEATGAAMRENLLKRYNVPGDEM